MVAADIVMSRQRRQCFTVAEVIERVFADENSEYEDEESDSESDDLEFEQTTAEFDPNIPGPSGLHLAFKPIHENKLVN